MNTVVQNMGNSTQQLQKQSPLHLQDQIQYHSLPSHFNQDYFRRDQERLSIYLPSGRDISKGEADKIENDNFNINKSGTKHPQALKKDSKEDLTFGHQANFLQSQANNGFLNTPTPLTSSCLNTLACTLDGRNLCPDDQASQYHLQSPMVETLHPHMLTHQSQLAAIFGNPKHNDSADILSPTQHNSITHQLTHSMHMATHSTPSLSSLSHKTTSSSYQSPNSFDEEQQSAHSGSLSYKRESSPDQETLNSLHSERLLRRRERNRIAARRSRERRTRYINDLEQRVERLTQENSELKLKIDLLAKELV